MFVAAVGHDVDAAGGFGAVVVVEDGSAVRRGWVGNNGLRGGDTRTFSGTRIEF